VLEKERKARRTAKIAAGGLPYWKDGGKSRRDLMRAASGSPEMDAAAAAERAEAVRKAEEEEAARKKAEEDPKASIKKKAKLGWKNIKSVATTHLDKTEVSEEGVKKMMMSTVRAVNETGEKDIADPIERLQREEERKRLEREEEEKNKARQWKKCIPNTTYFKTAGVSDHKKSKFLAFDAVLDVDAAGLRGMSVKPADVLKESVARIREARGRGGADFMEKKASVLKDVKGLVAGGGEGKRLGDLEEWQIYHVEKCLEDRKEGKSLPNLMGLRGKFKLSTRAPPELI
jgi:hypothetical protein